MNHPFADHIGLVVMEKNPGRSLCELLIRPDHLNPRGVVHGAVIFALADTGMGAALVPTLGEQEYCTTVEVKINYFRPAVSGKISCETTVVNQGKRLANLDARVYLSGKLIATANGTYAILDRKPQI